MSSVVRHHVTSVSTLQSSLICGCQAFASVLETYDNYSVMTFPGMIVYFIIIFYFVNYINSLILYVINIRQGKAHNIFFQLKLYF